MGIKAIKSNAIYSLDSGSNDEIDELNSKRNIFSNATSSKKLICATKKILVDGNQVFETNPHRSCVGGDNLITSISAASIMAKVYETKLCKTWQQNFHIIL